MLQGDPIWQLPALLGTGILVGAALLFSRWCFERALGMLAGAMLVGVLVEGPAGYLASLGEIGAQMKVHGAYCAALAVGIVPGFVLGLLHWLRSQ